MLDLQRQRYSPGHHAYIDFARGMVASHLVLGLLAAVLMLFHELFFTSLSVALWYLFSLGGVCGLLTHRQWCRILLGLLFFVGSAGGLFFLVWLAPILNTETNPLLPVTLLPFWLSAYAFIYAAGGIIMIISTRMQRATNHGFTLWDKVHY
jgi:hypothetical protein